MSFNPLKEKGIPVEKQVRNWHQIVGKPYNKTDVDCYTRTRQILMNGIEIEAWGFKHQLTKYLADKYNGLYVDIDDYASNSISAKIEAVNSFLQPENKNFMQKRV